MIVTFVSHDQVNLIRTKCRLENMLQSNCEDSNGWMHMINSDILFTVDSLLTR